MPNEREEITERIMHTSMPSSSIAARCPSTLYSPSRYLKSWLRVNNGAPSKNSSAMTQPALKQSIASVTFPSRFPSTSSMAIRDFLELISRLLSCV